ARGGRRYRRRRLLAHLLERRAAAQPPHSRGADDPVLPRQLAFLPLAAHHHGRSEPLGRAGGDSELPEPVFGRLELHDGRLDHRGASHAHPVRDLPAADHGIHQDQRTEVAATDKERNMTNAGLSPLRGLARLRTAKTRRFSSYDRTGGNDDRLHIEPGQTVTIAEYHGAGIVTHIWATLACKSDDFLRKIVLRAYWDGEEHPSIETPIGDFFGMGHARTRNFASLPVQASPEDGKAFNCYFPMPFGSHMKFTVTNEAEDDLLFYYYIDLELHEALEEGLGRFHAQYRQDRPKGLEETGLTNEQFLFGGENVDGKDNYTILEAEGHGHYVGVLFNVYSRRRSALWDWYGEGDDMIFVDGEPGISVPDTVRKPDPRIGPRAAVIEPRPESSPGANDAWPPTLHGTGTEDYFNTAWCP